MDLNKWFIDYNNEMYYPGVNEIEPGLLKMPKTLLDRGYDYNLFGNPSEFYSKYYKDIFRPTTGGGSSKTSEKAKDLMEAFNIDSIEHYMDADKNSSTVFTKPKPMNHTSNVSSTTLDV